MDNSIKSFLNNHPELRDVMEKFPIDKRLVSNKILELSSKNLNICAKTIEAFWVLRNSKEYKASVYKNSLFQATQDPGHYSMLMCFDFHITSNGPRLIEINTNASFSTIGWYLTETENCGIQNVSFDKLLKKTLYEESKHLGLDRLNIAIIDEDVQIQKTYFEFQYFKALFENWGHSVTVCDTEDLSVKNKMLITKELKNINFVYNRCCDFFFEKDKHQHLKEAFLEKLACFSPNPHEYNLLANKERFIDLSNSNFLDTLSIDKTYKGIINSTIPRSFNITDIDLTELKETKLNYVFKPKTSHGSKGVYIGKSISKTKLTSIYNDKFMAQEYIPPSKIDDFKYDLRIYVYKNEMQIVVARLYKGQVTNANSQGGGIARVVLKG